MIGQQAVPIVTDPAVALGDGGVEPLLLFGVLGTRPLVTPDPEDPASIRFWFLRTPGMHIVGILSGLHPHSYLATAR